MIKNFLFYSILFIIFVIIINFEDLLSTFVKRIKEFKEAEKLYPLFTPVQVSCKLEAINFNYFWGIPNSLKTILKSNFTSGYIKRLPGNKLVFFVPAKDNPMQDSVNISLLGANQFKWISILRLYFDIT